MANEAKMTMLINMTTGVPDVLPAQPNPDALNRGTGWSESYYFAALNNTTMTQFDGLCTARAALLPRQARIIGRRYQVVNPTGGSSSDSKKFPGTSTLNNDIPGMCLYARAVSSDGLNSRSLFLRGWPDAKVELGELFLTGPIRQSLTAFLAQLSTLGVGFFALDRGQAKVPVLTIVPNPGHTGQGILAVLQDVPAWATNPVIVLTQVKAANGQIVGRRVKILSREEEGTYIINNWPLTATATGGFAQAKVKAFKLIGSADFAYVIHKKTGGPTVRYRGRRSRRR